MLTKKAQLTGIVVILAVIGVIVGVMVTRQASSSASESSATASSGSGSTSVSGGSSDSSTTTSSSSDTGTVSKKKKKTSTSSSSGTGSITSDPTSGTKFISLACFRELLPELTATCVCLPAKFTLSAFAIGDWGTTVNQDSCCTRSSTFNDYDVNAEDIVASLMDQQSAAASAPPKCILSHG
jgi:tartrate-resistant acid phosphatase type 5